MLSWFQLGDTCMQFSGRMWVPCGSVIGQLTKKGRLGTAWVHSGWCAVCTVNTLSTHQSAFSEVHSLHTEGKGSKLLTR